MLRVAENLDRSHSQVISALTLRAREGGSRLELVANGDAELEVWATGRHIAPLEEVVGNPIRVVIAPHSMPLFATAKPARARQTSAAAARRSTPAKGEAPRKAQGKKPA